MLQNGIFKVLKKKFEDKIIIAGPCSAESYEQMNELANALLPNVNLYAFRGGVWKPRTRPNSFEGYGEPALKWMQNIEKDHAIQSITEVANAIHAKLALQAGFTKIWIGARTTANPFAVQSIADVLEDFPSVEVFIKNPINPDINLWVGAVERIRNAGIEKIGLIHRGFSVVGNHIYRNLPMWEIPLEMMSLFPDYPMLCDPSHIAGERDLLGKVMQKAMDLAFDGLMIETHPTPNEAMSDPKQQVTPDALIKLLEQVVIRNEASDALVENLEEMRSRIDGIDADLLSLIRKRMDVAQKIGQYKKQNQITIYQKERWEEIRLSRTKIAKDLGLSEAFMKPYLDALHLESIRQQNSVMNPNGEKK